MFNTIYIKITSLLYYFNDYVNIKILIINNRIINLILNIYNYLNKLKIYQLLIINFLFIILLLILIFVILCFLLKSIINKNNEYILTRLNYYTHVFERENINVIGMWGEDKLLNILNKFGLCKDIDFYKQKCFFINNKYIKPDYTIVLDKNTYLIVDVKTPWISYKKYIESNNKYEKHKALKEHSQTIKRHIKELSLKNYNEIKESLPFILMFVPIDDIITSTIKYESDLMYICKKYNIYIVTPNTICMLIDTIKQLLIRGSISKSLIKQKQNLNNIIDNIEHIDVTIDTSLGISNKNIKELINLKTLLNNNLLFRLKELKDSVEKQND
ncbi:DNA polymerase V [uncultured bacterium]|nr:DNA polymerase V [uncultured bacterium]